MRVIIILALCLFISGCGEKGERAYYEAANKPMVDIMLPAPGGGEYKIITRRPSIDQYENQWVRGIKAVGGIIATPAGTITAVGAVLSQASGKTNTEVGGDQIIGDQVDGDQSSGNGDFKTTNDNYEVTNE